MKLKIQTLLNQLNHGLVEREATIQISLLTVLARENIVLIGPPGTGKSLIARRIAESFSGSSDGKDAYFEYLLTKFSTPEEIFGPLSIAELKKDCFKRNTAGYLPTVQVAFLDEIFKASSSILNALLTILNERVYHNGAERQKVPLQALIAASNELPGDQDELGALYDRFLVRSFVKYVSQDNLHRLFEHTEENSVTPQLTLDDLDRIQHAAKAVTMPSEIVEAIKSIWILHQETFKEDSRETLSDRRLKKIIKLLCVSAATNGRKLVDLSDVFLLKDCLWNHPDNAEKVLDLVLKTLLTFSYPVPQTDVTLTVIDSGIPTYELGEDGETLILISSKSSVNPVQRKSKFAAKGSVVKNWAGSGTKSDPLQVSSIDDLLDIAANHIGEKDYYFIQTANIDGSAIKTWPKITFNGHYDGQGLSILADDKVTIFSTAKNASFKHIDLKGKSCLTGKTNDCIFENCLSGGRLISYSSKSFSLTNCTITSCKSGGSLISYNSVTDCTISSCTSGGRLISSSDSISNSDSFSVTNCTIMSCSSCEELISSSINSTSVTNCTITLCSSGGRLISSPFDFSSIMSWGFDNSSVTACAITSCSSGGSLISYGSVTDCTITSCSSGKSLISSLAVTNCNIKDCWAVEECLDFKNTNPKNEKNTVTKFIKINGLSVDGKKIDPEQWKQRYCENNLHWDFDSVWFWDSATNRPQLQNVGAAAKTASPVESTTTHADMTDLLTQQMSANIWL
jgi:MoxR-like ATPase